MKYSQPWQIVTFELKGLSDFFFAGLYELKSIKEKFDELSRLFRKGELGVKMQVGSGNQFNQQVDFNQALKKGNNFTYYKLSPKGASKVVATFIISEK